MKKQTLRKTRNFFGLIFLLLVVILFLISFTFQEYLYQMQTAERLSQIDDYLEYTLTVRLQNRVTLSYIFSYDNDNIYFEGIEQIYISYGSTTVFLEDIIINDYLTIDNILSTMKEIGTNNPDINYYYHKSTDDTKKYIIKVEEYEDYRDITFINYDESILEGLDS